MSWKKTDFYRTLLISILLWGSIFGGVLLCKHMNEKESKVAEKEKKSTVARRERESQTQQNQLIRDMLLMDRLDRLSGPPFNSGVMTAYTTDPENRVGYEGGLSGEEYKNTDIYLGIFCISGLKFLIVSRRVGDNVALDVEQVRNTDDYPMLCDEYY